LIVNDLNGEKEDAIYRKPRVVSSQTNTRTIEVLDNRQKFELELLASL